MTRTQAYWACQIGGWTGYTLIRLGPALLLFSVSGPAMVAQVLNGVLGLGLTHGFREGVHRLGWKRLDLTALAPRVLAAAVALAVAHHLVMAPVQVHLLGIDLYAQSTPVRLFVHAVGTGTFVYLVWSLGYFGVSVFERYRRAELESWKMKAQVQEARLQALKLQMNPHFLFNSLNSVRALISENPARAQSMVTKLSRLLRRTLQSENRATVPLRRELDTVRTYLDLESVRFEERLRYRIDVPESALSRHVPLLLVQTLVENAVKHGVARVEGGGTVVVDAAEIHAEEAAPSRASGEPGLRIRVDNPGRLDAARPADASESAASPATAPSKPRAPGEGVGLANVRERLQLLYGDAARLTLHARDDDHVRAEVVLPARSVLDGAPSVGDPPVRDQPVRESSVRNSSVRDNSVRDSSVRDHPVRDRPVDAPS